DGGRLVPTQNHGLDEFERTLADAGVARIAAQAGKAESDAETLEQNRRLLEKLNPGRVFRIHFPVAELVRRWTASLRAEDTDRRSSDRDLELLNAMLPTRLFIAEADAATRADLASLVRTVRAGATADEAVRAAFLRLFEKVTHGIYPVRGDALDFTEFTAIYP